MSLPIRARRGWAAFRWALLASASFAVLGLVAAIVVTTTPIFTVFYGGVGLPKRAFPLLVGFATGMVGGFCWWLFVERASQLTRERGVLVGLVTGLLVHPLSWVLILAVQNVQAGRWPMQGGLRGTSLFLYWGLALVGTFTVLVGVAGGSLLTVARERLSNDVVTGRNLLLVGAGAVLSGWLVLALVLVLGLFFPVVFGGGLLAAGITLVALRRLPVVRTFLAKCYHIKTTENSVRPGSSFRWRHAAVLVVGVIAFLIGALGYAAVVSFLCHSVLTAITNVSTGSIHYCRWDNRLTFYPAFFIVASAPVFLVANRFVNHWAPIQSFRRTAIEWFVFLALVSASYTASYLMFLRL